jgi:hypothetical protein
MKIHKLIDLRAEGKRFFSIELPRGAIVGFVFISTLTNRPNIPVIGDWDDPREKRYFFLAGNNDELSEGGQAISGTPVSLGGYREYALWEIT